MFEEILNNHLRKCSDITSYLTKYDDEPAIFNQTAPDDMSDLWNDNVQYGRIVFFANMQSATSTYRVEFHFARIVVSDLPLKK